MDTRKSDTVFNSLLEQNEITYTEVAPRMVQADLSAASRLAQTCIGFYALFQPHIDTIRLRQAIIDNDSQTVKRILDKNPKLLIAKPADNQVIESKLTWQQFYAKKPLEFAIQRGQLKMVKLMLPYFEELERRGVIKDGKKAALDQWKIRKVSDEEKQRYADKMKALIDVIAKETFPNNTQDKLFDRISEETKKAFEVFRKELLPDNVIALDNYVDVEQLLIASCQAFNNHYNVFQNSSQRDLYSICVLGLAQSMQMSEVVEVMCEGINDVINNKMPISARAAECKLTLNTPFYRASRMSYSGLGYDFLVSAYGSRMTAELGKTSSAEYANNLEKLYQEKIDELIRLEGELKAGYWPKHESKRLSFCSIL